MKTGYRWIRALAPMLVAISMLVSAEAGATLSVSPSTSLDGSYTVSWTDYSGYLATLFEWGPGTANPTTYTVTGSYSKSFTKTVNGTYTYQLERCMWDPETRTTICFTPTNSDQVVVARPGVPGAISCSDSNPSTDGVYTLSWGLL